MRRRTDTHQRSKGLLTQLQFQQNTEDIACTFPKVGPALDEVRSRPKGSENPLTGRSGEVELSKERPRHLVPASLRIPRPPRIGQLSWGINPGGQRTVKNPVAYITWCLAPLLLTLTQGVSPAASLHL